MASLVVAAAWFGLAGEGARDAPEDFGPATPSVQLQAPPPPWRPAARPHPTFVLEAQDLAGLPQDFEARSHADGGREEILRFGVWEEPSPYLHLAAHWPGAEAPPGSSFFVDLARRAAEAGHAVARSAQPSVVATRLGRFEIAEVGLSGAVERPCVAFRLRRDTAALGLSGWFCGAAGRPARRAQLVCLLDQLALTASADDLESRLLFAQAEPPSGESCGPRGASTEARRDSSSRPRAKAPAAGSASRGSRG